MVFLTVQNVEKLKFPSSKYSGAPKSPVVGMSSSRSSVSVRPNSDTDMYEANLEMAFNPYSRSYSSNLSLIFVLIVSKKKKIVLRNY